MYLIFIDYEKPFDRINHKNMQGALRRRGVPLTITCFILLGLRMHSFVFVQSYNHTRMYATTATDPYRNQRDFGRLSTITTSSSPPALWYANMLNYLAEYFCLIGRFTVISGKLEDASEGSPKSNIGVWIKKTKAVFASSRYIWKKNRQIYQRKKISIPTRNRWNKHISEKYLTTTTGVYQQMHAVTIQARQARSQFKQLDFGHWQWTVR